MQFCHPSKKIYLTGLILLFISLSRCTYDEHEIAEPETAIRLRWIQSYDQETWENVSTGFLWSLSFMGAQLPNGSFDASVTRHSNYVFSIDLNKLGFSEKAMETLKVVLNRLKMSDEYLVKGSMDLGRFLMVTLYSPNHYYRIVQSPGTLQQFKSEKNFSADDSMAVTNSTVSFHDRVILQNNTSAAVSMAFIANEINDQAGGTYHTLEYETIDVLENGQLRFALYDENGNLKTEASNTVSNAGKTGKCLWCHESGPLTMFSQNTDVPGYMTTSQFNTSIYHIDSILTAYQNNYSTEIIYENTQDHTQSEILYISFMEPSASRIANEWNISVEEVKILFRNFPTHVYAEFPFLGNLYYRNIVDLIAPYKTERVSTSARESSVYEPDFFN